MADPALTRYTMTQFWDRVRDWALLFALLVICILVIVNINEPMLRTLRAGSLEVTARVERYFAWAGQYVRALDENDALRINNVQLSSQVARLREAESENARLRALLSLRDSLDAGLLATRIIAKDITKQENYLTLNAGARDGITEGMAVIDDQGILGKVILTSTNFSIVQSYLNTDFRVPVRIQPIEVDGIVNWDGAYSDRLVLDYVVKTEPVKKGQAVVTHASLIFPSGLAVGTIDSVAQRAGENLYTLYLKPASPIAHADHAFVVMRPPNTEVDSLKIQAESP